MVLLLTGGRGKEREEREKEERATGEEEDGGKEKGREGGGEGKEGRGSREETGVPEWKGRWEGIAPVLKP